MNRFRLIWDAAYRVIVPICLVVMTFIVLAAWGESLYWRYGTFEPIVLDLKGHGGKISILNAGKTVCAGSTLVYGFDFEKTMDVPCTVKRQLVDGSLIIYDPISPPRKPIGKQSIVADLYVPQYAAEREWFMRLTIECAVGPNDRIIPVTAVSEKLKVVDCSTPKGKRGPQGKPGPAGPQGPPGKGITIFGK